MNREIEEDNKMWRYRRCIREEGKSLKRRRKRKEDAVPEKSKEKIGRIRGRGGRGEEKKML